MIRNFRMIGCVLFLVVPIAGCVQIPKEAGFGDVQQLVTQRVDYQLRWNQSTTADAEVEQAVARLLEDELSVDAATQISLLNNPDLQATYEGLGIIQADVVEAGLLENPVFFGRARFPNAHDTARRSLRPDTVSDRRLR